MNDEKKALLSIYSPSIILSLHTVCPLPLIVTCTTGLLYLLIGMLTACASTGFINAVIYPSYLNHSFRLSMTGMT